MDKEIIKGLAHANDQVIFFKYIGLAIDNQDTESLTQINDLYFNWLKNLPYNEYLLTKHWQDIKKAKLKQCGYQCSMCGETRKKLEVHHLTYKDHPTPSLFDLIILCRKCHKGEHGLGRKYQEKFQIAVSHFTSWNSKVTAPGGTNWNKPKS